MAVSGEKTERLDEKLLQSFQGYLAHVYPAAMAVLLKRLQVSVTRTSMKWFLSYIGLLTCKINQSKNTKSYSLMKNLQL